MHERSEEFEVRPDRTTEGMSKVPFSILTNPHRLIMGKTVLPLFSGVFDLILFKLAGNDAIHKSMDEFEILLDLTTDYRVSCSLVSKKIMLPLFLGCYLSDLF